MKKVELSIKATEKQTHEALKVSIADLRAEKDAFVERELKNLEGFCEHRKQLIIIMEDSAHQMREHSEEMEKFIRVTRRAADALTKRFIPALDELGERLDNLPKANLDGIADFPDGVNTALIQALSRALEDFVNPPDVSNERELVREES